MAQNELTQLEEDTSVAVLGTALIGFQLGYSVFAEVAVAGVMFGISGPRLWRHYARGEPLRTRGGHWSSIVFGAMILSTLALRASVRAGRDFVF